MPALRELALHQTREVRALTGSRPAPLSQRVSTISSTPQLWRKVSPTDELTRLRALRASLTKLADELRPLPWVGPRIMDRMLKEAGR